MGRPTGSKSIRLWRKPRLVDRFEDHKENFMNDSVLERRRLCGGEDGFDFALGEGVVVCFVLFGKK